MKVRRLLTRCGPIVFTAFAQVSFAEYTYYCQFDCGTSLPDGCYDKECPAPSSGCSLKGLQPFAGETVCTEYLESKPDCDRVGQQCSEAASFQLLYGRAQDFQRTFKGLDWQGVAKMFRGDAVAFTPGSANFLFQKDLAEAAETFYARTKVFVTLMLSQVLTTSGSAGSSDRVIHGVGHWQVQDGSGSAPILPYYVRFVLKPDDNHWVVETSVVGISSTITSALQGERRLAQDDPLFNEIASRNEELTNLYNSKNFSGMSAMYSNTAGLISRHGKPLRKADVQAFYETAPLGASAKLYPTIVAQSPGNEAVHEIGYSDSTRTGFLARWIKEGGQWVIETHMYAVFPQDGSSELIV